EFVREWLMAHGFMGKEGQQVPEMTDQFCEEVSERYIELYEHITGLKFEKAPEADLKDRIAKNVLDCLANLD
ncbi:MAG: phosphoribosylaminoimidazolesuccinocarboxamide synthase, partial [Duncaniella sp.]|nr:phosphoribosylaminoimidazolesuccinocarboxamide synthase [Duncaniella sp.]